MKKIKNYILAFIIPCLICLTFLYFKGAIKEIEDIYVSDLRLQHVVFLNYLKNVILGKASLYYSFSSGMGNPMLATLVFYCTSPVNILMLIIKDIRYAALFIYISKVSLAGLTMFIFLKSKTGKSNFMTVVFSTCYSLCAFVINYFYCILWLDSLYLAPIVMLGIDLIFKKERINLIYIFALALAICCNIQMGFGLCIFSVIYYLYSFNINYDIKKDFKKFIQLGIIFAISSLCAGAISSGFLLGFMSNYGDIASARGISLATKYDTANIGYIIKNLFTVGNLKADYYNAFEPFIYAGLTVSFFAILYLFNKNIDKKKRVHALLVMLVFIISFCTNLINLFWHLSAPVLLNFRYSAYCCVFLTMIAYESYINTDKIRGRDLVVLTISLLMGLFTIIAYDKEVYATYTFIFLILIFVSILLTKNKSNKFQILLVILMLCEVGINGYLSVYTADQLPYGKNTSLDSFREIASKNNFDDNYRVMYNYSYTDYSNDTLLLNKNTSLRYFSSVINGNLITFFNRVGSMNGVTNYRISAFDSPLLLSLLGNKYFYLMDDFNSGLYNKINEYKASSYDYVNAMYDTKDVYLFENPYALSLGYLINDDVKYDSKWDLVDYQNNIIKTFSGIDKDVIIRLDYSDLGNQEQFCGNDNTLNCVSYGIRNNTNTKVTYAYGYFNQFTVHNPSEVYFDINKPLAISSLDNELILTLKYDMLEQPEKFVAQTYNKENLINALDKLRANQMENIKINKNILTGSINAKKDGLLFLSIPYDKKFKIYVDGKETKYRPILDKAFIGVDIKEGEHTIKMEYVDSRLKLYILSSVVSIIITFILYYFVNKKIIKKQQEEERVRQQLLEERAKRAQNKKDKKEKEKKKKKR